MKKISITFFLSILVLSANPGQVFGLSIDAQSLVPTVNFFFTPRNGSFEEGATFEVPILINTNDQSVNSVEVKVNFNKDKLSIVKPSGGVSIVGMWIEPPVYDNTKGTANYLGVIPNGIKTSSGLIGTITFKAKASGNAKIYFGSNTKALMNDGLGTEANSELGFAEYTILPKAPQGIEVYSETHPSQNQWYNNRNPSLSWGDEALYEGFSYELDNFPTTIPDNKIDSVENSIGFENLQDGLWYFHIKPMKKGIWGSTTHFLIKIDTIAPASFVPEVDYLLASTSFIERALVSFFTTDAHSGIDHYEIGVIDNMSAVSQSPVFIEAESPYQLPLSKDKSYRVVIRAIDNAGNIRDESVAVNKPSILMEYINNNLVYILLGLLIAGFLLLLIRYIFSHHIIDIFKKASRTVKNESQNIQSQNENQNRADGGL